MPRLTPLKARDLVDGLEQKKAPVGDIVLAANTIALETPEWVLSLHRRISRLEQQARGDAPAAPVESPSEALPSNRPVPVRGGVQSSAPALEGGDLLTPEQAALAAQMEAETEGETPVLPVAPRVKGRDANGRLVWDAASAPNGQ